MPSFIKKFENLHQKIRIKLDERLEGKIDYAQSGSWKNEGTILKKWRTNW